MTYKFIRVNGTKLYIVIGRAGSSVSLDHRTGSLGEQCEDCGHDILEDATFRRDRGIDEVICARCSSHYPVQVER